MNLIFDLILILLQFYSAFCCFLIVFRYFQLFSFILRCFWYFMILPWIIIFFSIQIFAILFFTTEIWIQVSFLLLYYFLISAIVETQNLFFFLFPKIFCCTIFSSKFNNFIYCNKSFHKFQIFFTNAINTLNCIYLKWIVLK